MLDEITPGELDVLLVEYQKSQDSAEHHDNFVGSVTSLWLGSAVLVGFVLTRLGPKHLSANVKIALFSVTTLGIVLTLAVYSWAWRASRLKIEKYKRCKVLEERLGMEQHSNVSPARWWQDWVYGLLMALSLTMWVTVLVDVAIR